MDISVKHNRKTYRFLKKTRAKTNLLYGSAGSGKSWSIGQHLLLDKLYTERNIRILVIRKTRPALKKSCWLLMLDLMSKYDLPYTAINKSDLGIYANGNEMLFTSLDNVEKLKSFEKINYIWSEESTELSRKEFMQLHLRCRGENRNGQNRLYFSFNPIDEMSFLKPLTINPPESISVLHTTYRDNAFLSSDYVEYIESLQSQDEEYHKIYALGQWATPTNIIYTRWDVSDACERFDETYWGLDFGYSSNPAALVEIRVNGCDEIWERERLYEKGLTNPQLIERLGMIIENKNQMIIADCAEPKSIQEIRNAGFNIHPCSKGKDSVRFGINAVKSMMTHISSDSPNLIKEKQSYKWKVDKDDNVLDEPVKFNDHLMDAERYVLMKLKGKIKAGIAYIPKAESEDLSLEERAVANEMKMLNDDSYWT